MRADVSRAPSDQNPPKWFISHGGRVVSENRLAWLGVICNNGVMTDLRGETPTIERSKASVVRADLLRAAQLTEVILRASSQDVSDQISAQGRTDAIESVRGSNSLARAAVEVAAMIRQIEGEPK